LVSRALRMHLASELVMNVMTGIAAGTVA